MVRPIRRAIRSISSYHTPAVAPLLGLAWFLLCAALGSIFLNTTLLRHHEILGPISPLLIAIWVVVFFAGRTVPSAFSDIMARAQATAAWAFIFGFLAFIAFRGQNLDEFFARNRLTTDIRQVHAGPIRVALAAFTIVGLIIIFTVLARIWRRRRNPHGVLPYLKLLMLAGFWGVVLSLTGLQLAQLIARTP